MTDFVKKKYLNKLESLKDKVNLVKVITGIRGSGKSTLLNAEKESLLAKGINQKILLVSILIWIVIKILKPVVI